MIFKFGLTRYDHDRVSVTVFAGPSHAHLKNTGILTLTVGEWQHLGAALLLGEDVMRQHRESQGIASWRDITIEVEGEEEALRETS